MAKNDGLRPGDQAPRSGQYQEIGPRGGKGREVTSVKGEKLPPTTKPGSSYNIDNILKGQVKISGVTKKYFMVFPLLFS